MNTKRILTTAALAAALVCAAPAYSQVLGGGLTGGAGGALSGGMGGITGAGQGTLGGSFDSDSLGRVTSRTRDAASTASGKARDVTDGAKSKAADSKAGASGALSGSGQVAKQVGASAPTSSAQSNEAPLSAAQPSVISSPTPNEPSAKRSLDAEAGLDGNANASAKRDSTQPAGRKVDASADASANASARR